MTPIFDFVNYREYLNAWIESKGEHAYGMKGRIAAALGISSSLISQVLKGEKHLTPDQTSDLTEFMGLTELESDYLHLLVDFERAGNHRFKEKLKRKMRQLQEQSRQLAKRVPQHRRLSDEQSAIYYSSWIYTGIRTLTSIPEMSSSDAIAKALNLPPGVVNRVVRFLLETGLCREEDGRLIYGTAGTHINRDSPFVNKHHQNWRFQAIQHMEQRRDEDIFFTSPMTVSRETAADIRKQIPEFIQNLMKLAGPSPSETAACLNLDWFTF